MSVPYNKLYPDHFTAEDYINEETYKYTRAPVESAMTIIPDAFTNKTFYGIEQDKIFGNSWVNIGLTAQLQNQGDVIVADVAGQSIIVTRNKQGELRAFYNVCRHRGVKLLNNDCTAVRSNRIRCPYHSWAYDLDGKCLGTPLFEGSDIPPDQQGVFNMKGVAKFAKEDYPLFSVHADSWGFLIFVNLGENPMPLLDYLGDLPQRFANYKLEEWVIAREKEFIFEANYKLVAENFMEYYHLPWVHPELIQVSRMEDHYRWQGPGMYTGMTTWPISQGEDGGWLGLPPMSSLSDINRESARFIFIFPNVAISVMPNHTFVMLTKPDGPARTIEQTWILCHPESLEADGSDTELDQLTDFWTLVNEQDIDIVQRVQAGLSMKAYRGGRMCYHFEEPIHRFHNMIIDKMVGMERVPQGDAKEQLPMFTSD